MDELEDEVINYGTEVQLNVWVSYCQPPYYNQLKMWGEKWKGQCEMR